MWPREGTREVQRHRRMRIWGDTPIKGPPAFTVFPLLRHQGTCLRSPDAFAPHRVLMHLEVVEKPFQRVRLAGPPLGKSLSIGLPWRPSWWWQPSCWQSPFGYYRWWAAGCVCSVHDLTHFSGRDAALPRNALSGRCKYVVSCCCPYVPSSFLTQAWDRQWRNYSFSIDSLGTLFIFYCLSCQRFSFSFASLDSLLLLVLLSCFSFYCIGYI